MLTDAQKRAAKKYMKKYSKTARGREVIGRAIKRWRLKLKKEVLSHYSNGEIACVKCGEGDIACLSIDHVEGGGGEHLKQIGGGNMFYPWLKKLGYPEGFQTLCMNCQWKKKAPVEEEGYCDK